MEQIAFFDTKPYDKEWFLKLGSDYKFKFYESKLTSDSAELAKGCRAVVAFVNDTLDKDTIDKLCEIGVELIAMRCSGFNNVDIKYAKGKINIVRVPTYSPYAVAEHAMAMLLTLNRKIHKAYNRTREFNFSLNGLTGFDLYGKTAGIIGTGQIGCIFMNICRGFGMNIVAYDPYPKKDPDINYVSLGELLGQSSIISLHCPLTPDTKFIINNKSIEKMKDGAFIVNTSRGKLIDSGALISALKSGKVGGACLDVYEEETSLFFEDWSGEVIDDDELSVLISMPNVIITSHQAFLTKEALQKIAEVTIYNLNQFFEGKPLENRVEYTK
ncbi:MAG: 2-hydroxyacid dehydrogenase [Oscillospiraceae bacterium]